MTVRAAMPGDAEQIEAFLAGHAETSMFLRANLAAHGPCGGAHPHATQFWFAETGGAIRGVLGRATSGMAMVQAPGLSDEVAATLAPALAGQEIAGLSGPPAQVVALRRALGLASAPVPLADTEPLYALALDALGLPEGATRLARPCRADLDTLADWRRAHHLAFFGTPAAEAETRARAEVERMQAEDRLRVLVAPDGTPCAMTAFNAVLPDIVQVGAVFTPPALRNRGHARRAVALHLAEARAAGAARAILFAASAPACRAYEAIGFRRIGSFALVLFGEPRAATQEPVA